MMPDQHVRASIDILALLTVWGAWAEHLPAIAAVLGGFWYATQILDWVIQKFKNRKK